MEGMLLLVVLHPTASSMLSLKAQEAHRVDQEGQWEVEVALRTVFVQGQCCAIQGTSSSPRGETPSDICYL